MRNAYRVVKDKKSEGNQHRQTSTTPLTIFLLKKKYLERHLNVSGHMHPELYINLKTKTYKLFLIIWNIWEIFFSIYFDFETTSEKKMCNFDENSTLYPVWYAFAVAFHPGLNIDRKFVVRGFRHTFKQLNNFQFVPAEMLPYFDPITVR